MKTKKMTAVLLALLAACTLASCGQSEDGKTQNTATSQETTTGTPGIETPSCTEEYVDPSDYDAANDKSDYSALSLPDYTAENPVRYLNEDSTGKYNGWQNFGTVGEIQTIARPVMSTYTYQMYSYYIRNDLSQLYGRTTFPAHLSDMPAWLTKIGVSGQRKLWYSMGHRLPDGISLLSTETLTSNDGTQTFLKALYTLTLGESTEHWAVYFIDENGVISAFAVKANESPDTVFSFTDGIVKTYQLKADIKELAYDGILYYQYAADVNYYSCMYLMPTEVKIWNTHEKPNVAAPESSAGFDTAYTIPLDIARYAATVQVAVDEKFEKIDAEKANYPWYTRGLGFPPSVIEPEHTIAVYRDGNLLQMIGNTDTGFEGDVDAFYALRRKLQTIRNSLAADAISSALDSPKVVAVLITHYGGYSSGNVASYYTDGTLTHWTFDNFMDEPLNFASPLDSAKMTDKTEYTIGNLPTFEGLDFLPMEFATPSEYAMDDVGSFAAVFYLEDGSVRVTSSSNMNEVSPVWNKIKASLNVLWDARVPKA